MPEKHHSKASLLSALLFVVIWWIFTGMKYRAVMKAYAITNLSMALLTADSIFFSAVIILLSILISMSGTKESSEKIEVITRPMRSLSIGIAILIIANISSYFTYSWMKTIAVYYQIWSLPAFMLEFYYIFQQ